MWVSNESRCAHFKDNKLSFLGFNETDRKNLAKICYKLFVQLIVVGTYSTFQMNAFSTLYIEYNVLNSMKIKIRWHSQTEPKVTSKKSSCYLNQKIAQDVYNIRLLNRVFPV